MSRVVKSESDEAAERLALVVDRLVQRLSQNHGRLPDGGDLVDELRPYIKQELVKARIDEAQMSLSKVLSERIRELTGELKGIKFSNQF
jgi:hypothetical protein